MIGMRGGVAMLGAIMALASLASAAAPPAPEAPLVCRRVKRLRPPLATPDTSVVPGDGAAVELHDRFDVGTRATAVRVHRMRVLCAPAGTTAAPAGESALASFAVEPLPGSRPRPIDTDDVVETLFGPTEVNVRALQRLMVSADTAPAGERPDGFDPSLATQHTCYEVRPKGDDAVRRIDLLTADGAWQLRASRPRHLCVPVGTSRDPSRPDYMCWQAKLRRGAPVLPKVAREATSVFGRERVRLGEVRALCLPTETELVPPPPPPGFELELDPPAQEVEWRELARFRAIARWDDGRTQDVTPQVEWTSADQAVAAPALDDDGAFRAREPGSVVVHVKEPLSGKTATATLGVRWSLERIELAPAQVNRAVGQHEDYQATGWFAGGVRHNVTERLTYATSDAAVASPSADDATPSRVEPKKHGTVTVSACDPRTGVCADDATMIVLGGLQSIELGPQTEIAVGNGEILPLTATGRFADGRQKNLTQKVEWRVADPRIAETGEHGVLVGLARGQTTVIAVDPKTGLASPPRTVRVLGAMQELRAYDTNLSPRELSRKGDARRLTAVAVYEDGERRNLTQRVEWSSLDPTLIETPNTPGDRSRVHVLGFSPGRVMVRDPRTGLTSGPATVHVMGPLEELVASPRRQGGHPLPVGTATSVKLSGRFASGPTPWLTRLNFNNFRPADEYEMFSTDPSVLQPGSRGSVRAVGAGIASVWFRDKPTGITSNLVTFTVKGEMERIALEPAAITRGIGEGEEFLALGHHQPSLTTLLTQDLVYHSSDERVAIATNAPGHRSRVIAVGPGTATISAVDPTTGMRTTDGGGDAVITVLPGTIERITISPAVRLLPVGGFEDFTATGHYPDGRTINVTSQVTWTSSAPQVAPSREQCRDLWGCFGDWWNDPEMGGGPSRVVGAGAGTVFLTATHEPSGVSSSHSGNDAVVVVEDVAQLELLPQTATLAVGEILPYRTRAVLTGGQMLDVTDQVFYRTDDFDVAWNDVEPDVDWDVRGRVNEIVAKAPGSATVIASIIWGESAEASLTVVAPTSTTTTTSTSTTLPAGATLALDPPVRTVDFAEPATFRALIGTVDVTERAEWTVVDGTIAAGEAGVFATRDPGTTTVTAYDPVTGMQASATLVVDWTLQSIAVHPPSQKRRVGDRARFQAIGRFAGGRTLDLSTRVRFAVSNGTVAAIDAGADHPGEVLALADGDTQVIACDFRSSICSGGLQQATLRVDPSARRFLVVQYADGGFPLLPGQRRDLTVQVWHVEGDSHEDVTADVTWSIDVPDVVRVVREGPTGLRLYGLRPGVVQIRFEHEDLATFAGATVHGPLAQLFATVSKPFPMGKSGAGLAWGYDARGAFRRATYDVEWRSLDPHIIATPNDPAKPNLLIGVSPGTARIVARDPATGLESAPMNALVYGELAGVDTDPKDAAGEPPPWLIVGSDASLRAVAVFEGGYTRCVACRWPYPPVRWESSDPSVLEVVHSSRGRASVRAVAPGFATVRAFDEETGLGGAGKTYAVVGGLDRIALQPEGPVVRGIGEREWLTAIGRRVPGVSSNMTQWVWWESSDPSVATVSNDWSRRGEIQTHAAGTAVISARAGDVSSTETGDDVTVTVLPGTLERIVVSPAYARRMVGDAEEFTATGYYADGTTLNVTKQVEWRLGTSSVAGAFALPERRSLFEGVEPGTTTVTAVHPSGVSSDDSGESSTLEVDAVVGLEVEPEPWRMVPGQIEELTVHAVLASGERRNVTQLAEYVAWPLGTKAIDVPNAAPRKSRFTATGLGHAEIAVTFGGQVGWAAIRVVPSVP